MNQTLQEAAPAEAPRPKTRWTYEQYYRMADMGMFRGQRVELIAGEIIEMPAQGEPHGVGILLAERELSRAFGKGFVARTQLPLKTGENEEPEPDVAIVAGEIRDTLRAGRPRSALLVVEISESTLAYDLGEKAEIYASAGIEDYWVLDIVNRLLHVHRQTIADPSVSRGRRYSQINVLDASESVAPLSAASHPIRVADLLP